jgi:hypothetical protein
MKNTYFYFIVCVTYCRQFLMRSLLPKTNIYILRNKECLLRNIEQNQGQNTTFV